jgi:hypothetical protein
MATIEGNEIALRNVFDEYNPRSRDKSTAQENNDTTPPFITQSYEINANYGVSLAPSWVYALTYEGPGQWPGVPWWQTQQQPGGLPIMVSFGAANGSAGGAETVLYPGQTIEFPRGARRVFVRAANLLPTQLNYGWVELTWKTDLWARKIDSSGNIVSTQLVNGNGVPVIGNGWGSYNCSPRSSLIIGIDNDNTTVATDLRIEWGDNSQFTLATGSCPAGQQRVFHFGPGIGTNLPANSFGANITFPSFVTFYVSPAAPPPPGESCAIGWWVR